MYSFKNGALIAIAAGTLFTAACKKKEDAAATEPVKAAEPTKAEPAAAAPAPSEPAAAPAAAPAAGEQTAKVHCLGVNECKGKGACKTATNACGGQNGCGGKGMVEMAEADCKAKGGTVAAN
jgi:hypothetical protein